MYKGISRFLQRLKKQITDFGAWRQSAPRISRSDSASTKTFTTFSPIENTNGAAKDGNGAQHLDVFFEELPAIPLLTNDREALWLGSADLQAHEFFKTASVHLLSISNVSSLSCAEIAVALNKIDAVYPRNGKWDSRLVYHFTRHYTSVRPRYYD
jgi:hypothetical protein